MAPRYNINYTHDPKVAEHWLSPAVFVYNRTAERDGVQVHSEDVTLYLFDKHHLPVADALLKEWNGAKAEARFWRDSAGTEENPNGHRLESFSGEVTHEGYTFKIEVTAE